VPVDTSLSRRPQQAPCCFWTLRDKPRYDSIIITYIESEGVVRQWFLVVSFLTVICLAVAAYYEPRALWSLVVIFPLLSRGLFDSFQKEHAILRNFPLIGHGRYLLESIRPEIQQYFIEMDTEGKPMSREERSVVYQRAKNELDTIPFGTQHDVYKPGFEWVNHSLTATAAPKEAPRVLIGGPDCTKPYDASLLNVSAMSFGALSPTAVQALNEGARKGGFAHNTGEGGISPYHAQNGGDLIWQIGTGYFGCRTLSGEFNPEMFAENASREAVKMIEIKLSQGAKPGHGGILPGAKVNAQIAQIRGVEIGKDVISPPSHRAFSNPIEFCEFIKLLRELSGGKPVGFKLCVGRPSEFASICKAMIHTGITPDFITVDGKEGGTGAAPLEFSNSVGMPLREGLKLVHNMLLAAGLRDRIKIIAAGKLVTGFDLFRALALGADVCYSARGFMLALGCIQALRCNSNICPTGVATQNRALWIGLDPVSKAERVYRFQKATVHSFLELAACAGLKDPRQVPADLLMRRIDESTIKTYEELHPMVTGDCIKNGDAPEWILNPWNQATHERF